MLRIPSQAPRTQMPPQPPAAETIRFEQPQQRQSTSQQPAAPPAQTVSTPPETETIRIERGPEETDHFPAPRKPSSAPADDGLTGDAVVAGLDHFFDQGNQSPSPQPQVYTFEQHEREQAQEHEGAVPFRIGSSPIEDASQPTRLKDVEKGTEGDMPIAPGTRLPFGGQTTVGAIEERFRLGKDGAPSAAPPQPQPPAPLFTEPPPQAEPESQQPQYPPAQPPSSPVPEQHFEEQPAVAVPSPAPGSPPKAVPSMPSGEHIAAALDAEEKRVETPTVTGPFPHHEAPAPAPYETSPASLSADGSKRFKLNPATAGVKIEISPGYTLTYEGMGLKGKEKGKAVLTLSGPGVDAGTGLAGRTFTFMLAKNKAESMNQGWMPFRLTFNWHKTAFDEAVYAVVHPKPVQESGAVSHTMRHIVRHTKHHIRNNIPEVVAGAAVLALTVVTNVLQPWMQEAVNEIHFTQLPVMHNILASHVVQNLLAAGPVHAGALLESCKAHLYNYTLPAFQVAVVASVIVRKVFRRYAHKNEIKRQENEIKTERKG